MPRRVTLTDRQREALLHLPVDQGELLRHYTLSDEDLGHIRQRRRAHNRFGFALQLCVLRYPGRVLAPGELIPAQVSDFIAAQLGLTSDDLLLYAAREETRHEHLADLRRIYGYRSFSGRGARDLREWIAREAEAATSNEDLARRFVAECRRTRTILPGSSTIERLCADALVEAERRIEDLIAHRITPTLSENLAHLLEDTVDGRVTRFVWLRQFEVGANSAAANRLMDRLEYLQRFDLPADLLDGVPLRPGEWLAERRARLDTRLKEFGRAARTGTIPGGIIENGKLHIDKLRADTPEGAEDLVLDLYQQLPPARITDLLLEVDERTGFSEAFTHLRTGAPCSDRIGLMNVLLAEGVNLGLRKMAAATNTHSFWELLRIARWHVEGSAYDRALAMIVEAHAALPMAAFWGQGQSASSDGQFFLATEQGEAMNLINAKYGNVPGLKGYSHVSDQYAPFATQVIPATVSEAPYILDGLLMNDAGRRVRQHFADTGGFTDHVFAACALLGYRFAPRIRDLPQKRLYAFTPNATPANVRALVGGKINEPLIERNWPDILRIMATIAAGIVAPSQILRKLASYPRQNELALALREVGRIERTLFMIDWILDAGLQRQAQIGLNKGEAHHALKRAISFHRRGEIRDRSGEGQHYRIAGMNLLAAIIIFWNTMKLGEVVNTRAASGTHIAPDLLAHVSPLGWEHINLTGEYRWPKSLA